MQDHKLTGLGALTTIAAVAAECGIRNLYYSPGSQSSENHITLDGSNDRTGVAFAITERVDGTLYIFGTVNTIAGQGVDPFSSDFGHYHQTYRGNDPVALTALVQAICYYYTTIA